MRGTHKAQQEIGDMGHPGVYGQDKTHIAGVRGNGGVAVVLVWITLAFRAKRQAKPITDLGVTMPLNQPGGAPASAEAYEVYSALYQAPVEEMLAFAEDSVTDVPQVNGNCLRPATAQEQEMTVAFVAANRQSHRWDRKFSIPQGYRLLPQTELARARLRYVRLLGNPGFNHAHTRALVSVIKSCGHFCGSGGIFAVEKMGGIWQRSPNSDFTRDCSGCIKQPSLRQNGFRHILSRGF